MHVLQHQRYMCSKYGFGVIISEGIIDYALNVMLLDRVPLKNVESLYGGGVSSLPGAARDPPPVMFPVAPVLLAGGPQLGPWQVAAR